VGNSVTAKLNFLGPIISTNRIDEWKQLLINAFGMDEACRQSLTSAQVEQLWGLVGHSAVTSVFQTANTPYGIRLLQLDPASSETIRKPESGYDCNALKVIDFFTADFEGARQRLESAGYRLKEDIAEYDTENGHIIEAHLWGPDNVVCALVAGPEDFLAEFVTVTDRLVSEVHSVSAPVSDQPAVVRFYESLGLDEVHRYEITDESFQHLVGASEPLHIRAINMGVRREAPYFGLIHYGLPSDSYASLAGRACLPNRGLVGATLRVPDVSAAVENCQCAGATVLAGTGSFQLAPYGNVASAAVRAPHGVIHHLLAY
jgi:catechol 2,3-dioxygenase-like lactoylglutathione lyase family enzyme